MLKQNLSVWCLFLLFAYLIPGSDSKRSVWNITWFVNKSANISVSRLASNDTKVTFQKEYEKNSSAFNSSGTLPSNVNYSKKENFLLIQVSNVSVEANHGYYILNQFSRKSKILTRVLNVSVINTGVDGYFPTYKINERYVYDPRNDTRFSNIFKQIPSVKLSWKFSHKSTDGPFGSPPEETIESESLQFIPMKKSYNGWWKLTIEDTEGRWSAEAGTLMLKASEPGKIKVSETKFTKYESKARQTGGNRYCSCNGLIASFDYERDFIFGIHNISNSNCSISSPGKNCTATCDRDYHLTSVRYKTKFTVHINISSSPPSSLSIYVIINRSGDFKEILHKCQIPSDKSEFTWLPIVLPILAVVFCAALLFCCYKKNMTLHHLCVSYSWKLRRRLKQDIRVNPIQLAVIYIHRHEAEADEWNMLFNSMGPCVRSSCFLDCLANGVAGSDAFQCRVDLLRRSNVAVILVPDFDEWDTSFRQAIEFCLLRPYRIKCFLIARDSSLLDIPIHEWSTLSPHVKTALTSTSCISFCHKISICMWNASTEVPISILNYIDDMKRHVQAT